MKMKQKELLKLINEETSIFLDEEERIKELWNPFRKKGGKDPEAKARSKKGLSDLKKGKKAEADEIQSVIQKALKMHFKPGELKYHDWEELNHRLAVLTAYERALGDKGALDKLKATQQARAAAKAAPGEEATAAEPEAAEPEAAEPEAAADAKDERPIPIFKDMRDSSGKRVGANEGGQGLQSLLQNWANKNAAKAGFDDKAIQTAIRQIVQDVAKQLKANKISIQEAKISEYVISSLSSLFEGVQSRGMGDPQEGKLIQDLNSLLSSLDSEEEVQKFIDAVKVGKHPGEGQLNKGGQKKVVNYYTKNEAGIKLLQDKLNSFKPVDKPIDRGPVGLSLTLDGLQNRLKELDLDSDEGMYAAGEPGNEQAYLGAYMFYKALKKLQKNLQANPNMTDQAIWKLVRKEIEGGSPYSPKRTGPVREQEEDDDEGNRELVQWLNDTITKFEKNQLNDPKRAVKASKQARRVKEPKEKAYEPKVKAAGGELNTKQSVIPRLKQAGIDIKSPEGQKLAKNLLRLIKRFVERHFERTGVNVDKIVTEQKIQDISLQILERVLSNRSLLNELLLRGKVL